MKFLNIKSFADLKKCSRETVYRAEKNQEIDINRTAGFPVIFLTDKNKEWEPRRIGRPKKEILKIS